jgi:hypothetical protein
LRTFCRTISNHAFVYVADTIATKTILWARTRTFNQIFANPVAAAIGRTIILPKELLVLVTHRIAAETVIGTGARSFDSRTDGVVIAGDRTISRTIAAVLSKMRFTDSIAA